MNTRQPTRLRVRPGIWKRTNLDGSTVYEITYRDSDGRQRRQTVGSKLKEAEARLAQVKADMSRGGRIAPNRSLTVAVAAETFLENGTGHLRPSTFSHYRSSLDCHILPAFGRKRLEDVTPDDLARWITKARSIAYAREHHRSKAYAAATVNHALRTLKRVYGHAIRRQGFAGTCPVDALERHERPRDEPKPKVILTPEQLAAVVAAAVAIDAEPGRYSDKPRYAPVLQFLAGTGCRVNEALGLTWGDLDLTGQRTASIAFQLDRKTHSRVALKTPKSTRSLDLPGSLVTMLATLKLVADASTPLAFVFTSMTGGPMDDRNLASRGLRPACKAAGIDEWSKVRIHDLRHAHGSALLYAGQDLPYVSRRLGHASVLVTAEVYSHMLDDRDKRQMRRECLDTLYGGSSVAAV